MKPAFSILERKRAGESLSEAEIRDLVAGASAGASSSSWGDAELGAFLMAAAVRGLDLEETRALTLAMLESGEQWDLAADFPALVDKHSTGGVADTVSLILAPLLAACGVPVVMLTGRSLGHTGGTADKLESIPGLRLDLDRAECCRLLDEVGTAIGVATGDIAPADRRLYALRDRTATISSIPLITASIASKKLATGAAALVFDVKTGNGAFLPDRAQGEELARRLVETVEAAGRRSSALVTDMNQPLGVWAGHTAEVRATFEALEGEGAADLMEVTYALCEAVAEAVGQPVSRRRLEDAVASGKGRDVFVRWAERQGADPAWLAEPRFELATVEVPLRAPGAGVLAGVDTTRLGLLLSRAARGSRTDIDYGVSLRMVQRLGDELQEGQELARLYLRREDEGLIAEAQGAFTIDPLADPEKVRPPLVERL
ncbi:MAG: thymidine phosphorylase [Acidobacteriota bacterium]